MSADRFQGGGGSTGESIMHDLSDAFSTLLSPQVPNCQFAGVAVHDHSPNPLLSVKGRGRIGIPLVYDDKSPEETTGDATGNIWVAAKDVRIGNTAWSKWLEEKSSLVVKDMGISPENVALEQGGLWLVSDPTMIAELSSLSASSPSANHLGFLLVSLPSFAPYELNLHHPDDKDERIFVKAETEDLSARTVVAAFYKKTAIMLQTEGHTDGQARWSFLVYKLLYKAASDTPVLPTTAGLLARTLSGPVSKWIQWEYKKVPYLSYVLERHYSSPFEPKGRDLVRVKTFERLARELGLKMYVAEMTLEISGSTDREESPYSYDKVHYGYGRYGRYDSDSDSPEEDPYDMEMDDIDSEEVDVRYWTDWRSKVSQPYDVVLHRPHKYSVHILPSNFWDDIAEDKYTLVPTYDDDTLTHTFTYTTVFLWPEKDHASVLAELFGQDGIRWLDPTFWNDTDEGRMQRDKFAEILINGLDARTKPKIQSFTCSDLHQESSKCTSSENETLFTFAYQQGRADLVLKVVKAFGLPDISMVETAMAALKINTDENIADFVLQCVDAEDVPIKKLQWIISLNSGNETLIQSQINSILESEDLLQCLKKPDVLILHSLLGSRLFCACILPNLKSNCDSSIWVAALRLVRADVPEDVKPYITSLVVQVVASMGQTATPAPGYRPGHSGSNYTSAFDRKAMELFEFCLEPPREIQLAATILDKLVSFTLSGPKSTDPSKLRAVLIGYMREVHIVLQRHAVPYTAHNFFPGFIQLALLDGVLPGLGPRPPPPTKSHTPYALKAVSCNCAHCKQLNTFLTSPSTSSTNIHTTAAGRDHLRIQLKSERNRAIGQHVQISAVGSRNGRMNLKKIKEANPTMAHALAMWEAARRDVEGVVKLVESGGALNGWGHLVLGVVRPGGMGWNKTAQEAVAMELKKPLPAKNTQSVQPTLPDRSAATAISWNIDGGGNTSTGIPPFREIGQSGNGDAKRKGLNAAVDRDAKKQKQESPVEIIELIDSD